MQRVSDRSSLDEWQTATIRDAMLHSFFLRDMVRLKMYDPHEELLIEGVIDFIDPAAGKFAVDGEWFDVSRIVTLA